MKRIWFIALAVSALVTILIGAVFLNLTRLPGNARLELDQYLAFRYPPGSHPAVEQTSPASRPWLYKAELSGTTYANNAYFQSDHMLGKGTGGARPMPYPPQDVWCARVATPESGTEVVLVALHNDLWNGAGVVHELPEGSPAERRAVLSEVGCAVPLDDS